MDVAEQPNLLSITVPEAHTNTAPGAIRLPWLALDAAADSRV